MRFLPVTIEIGDDEGFASEKDIFGRRDFANGLTTLVQKSEDPLVLLLDSPWGTGKSTFIKMWIGELKKRKFPVIYFDAFENDHVESAFVAIAAEVIRLAEEKRKTKTGAYKKFLKRAGRVGGVMLRTGARVGVKAATLGAIDATEMDALKSVAADIAADTSTKADEYVQSLLKMQSQEKKSLEELRKSLAELAGEFSESEVKLPLVFVIDELDRCRPNFALEILEHVKHIFSIDNVHFLLAAQIGQLENSVRFSYGSGIDALTYLQKFYNVLLHFPAAGAYRHERLIPKFVAQLCRSLSLPKDAMDVVSFCAEGRSLSFRTIERIATCVSLARAFVPSNHLWIAPIIGVLCVMKIVDPALFHRAREQNVTLGEIDDFMRRPIAKADRVSFNIEWVLAWWEYCLSESEPDRKRNDISAVHTYLFRYSVDRDRLIPLMAGYIDTFEFAES